MTQSLSPITSVRAFPDHTQLPESDPPERGAEAPYWFYVPNVPPLVDGEIRRSYVLWREYMVPLIAIELASGNGSEERDKTLLSRTPEGITQKPGKFWVYEQIIRIPYYAQQQKERLAAYLRSQGIDPDLI